MSHPVQDRQTESVGQWLPLIEYSMKSGVSLSTIRRKIKANQLSFKLEKGKYLILFNPGVVNSTAENMQANTSETIINSEKLRLQQERIKELEQELSDMALLVQTLEKKYGVQY